MTKNIKHTYDAYVLIIVVITNMRYVSNIFVTKNLV